MSRAKTSKKPAATSSTAIVKSTVREYQGLAMAFAPAEAQRRLQELQAFVRSVMVPDVDFMTVGADRVPSLLQPGAQKLAEVYGFYHHFEDREIVKDWTAGFFYFEYRCLLFSKRDDSKAGEGLGSCNSREAKYAGRWVPRKDVPSGMNLATLQTRQSDRWVFESELRDRGIAKDLLQVQWREKKKGGGQYPVYRLEDETFFVPNPDPYSLVNTLQKMAAKRAYIHAVIGATRSAGLFTQDLEDLPPEAYGKVDTHRSYDRDPPAAAASTVVEGEVVSDTAKPEPVKPKPKPAADVGPEVDVEPSAEQIENGRDMLRAIVESPSLEVLAARWTNTKTARDHGLITAAQRKRLGEIKDRRKAALEAPPADSTDDGNEAMGIAPAEPCFYCKKPVGDDAIEFEGPEGALVKKHPACTAFGQGEIKS